jgi:hypothetical protein
VMPRRAPAETRAITTNEDTIVVPHARILWREEAWVGAR